MNDRAEAHNYWGLNARAAQEVCSSQMLDVMRDLEKALRACTTRMHLQQESVEYLKSRNGCSAL